jgi:hypothetical protein
MRPAKNVDYFQGWSARTAFSSLATAGGSWQHPPETIGSVCQQKDPNPMKKTLVAIFFAGNDVGRFEGLRAAKGKVKGTISLGSGLAGLAAASDDLLLASTGEGKFSCWMPSVARCWPRTAPWPAGPSTPLRPSGPAVSWPSIVMAS